VFCSLSSSAKRREIPSLCFPSQSVGKEIWSKGAKIARPGLFLCESANVRVLQPRGLFRVVGGEHKHRQPVEREQRARFRALRKKRRLREWVSSITMAQNNSLLQVYGGGKFVVEVCMM
jgi:hypothetical protein